MMRFTATMVVTLLAGLFLSTATAATTPVVTLTIDDEAGFDRVDEPVTAGVPFAVGKVADAARLVLLDEAGKSIPCQFTEVARHLDGKSVKWVHVTWLQSVKAGKSAKVTVALADAPQSAGRTSLSVELKGNVATVQTGFVKFVVRGTKFNGVDGAWFDPKGQNNFDMSNPVIAPGNNSGSKVDSPDAAQVSVADLKFKVDGQPKSYDSANDGQGKVVIEEQGPRRVVVKAFGRHLDGKGNKALDYIVRYYAYSDSPIVRVQHTFVNRQGKEPTDLLFISSLNLSILTRLAGGKVTLGTEGAPMSLEALGEIYQDSSDTFSISQGPKLLGGGKGKSTKPLTTGWADLNKDGVGLAVGVKWFWQMFPKSLAVGADGTIKIGLYPTGTEQPLEVYMGQSRTHYLTLAFHDDKSTAKELNAIFAAQNRPLRAWASPRYYGRDTMCFGPFAEDDKELFGEDWDKVEKFDSVMLESVKMLAGAIDDNEYNGVRRDSYGIYAWGDRFHWGWPKWDNAPFHVTQWKESWAGNYYDYPNGVLMQFLRTGDKTFLDRFWPNAVQIGDVHTANYHSHKELIGECRYCPPRNFVAVDNGTPYVSNEFNHYKTQSVFAHWYLTGDRRSYEHCELLASSALLNHAADSGWAARGIGAQMAGLWNAYELWRDPKYFDRLKGLAGRAMKFFKGGSYAKSGDFMWGIANEGLCYYYWVSGDEQVIETFKAGLPKCKAKTGYPNMALCNAMTYRVTGDKQFADWAWRCLGRHKPSSRVHGPGCQFRGNSNALFFLSDVSKDWKPYAGPVGDGKHVVSTHLLEQSPE